MRLPADVTALKQLTADLAIERVEKHSPATSSADSANSSYEDSDGVLSIVGGGLQINRLHLLHIDF